MLIDISGPNPGFERIDYNIHNNQFKSAAMFSFLKPDPIKKLRKHYDQKLEKAMQAQRKGDIKTYSLLTAESETIWHQIEALEKSNK